MKKDKQTGAKSWKTKDMEDLKDMIQETKTSCKVCGGTIDEKNTSFVCFIAKCPLKMSCFTL